MPEECDTTHKVSAYINIHPFWGFVRIYIIRNEGKWRIEEN